MRLAPSAFALAIACLHAGPVRAATWDCQATFLMEQVGGVMKRVEGGDIPPNRGHYTIDADQGFVSVGDTPLFTFAFDIVQRGDAANDTILELGPSTRIAVRTSAKPARFIHIGHAFDVTYGECSETKVVLRPTEPTEPDEKRE